MVSMRMRMRDIAHTTRGPRNDLIAFCYHCKNALSCQRSLASSDSVVSANKLNAEH